MLVVILLLVILKLVRLLQLNVKLYLIEFIINNTTTI